MKLEKIFYKIKIDSNLCLSNFIRQEALLTKVLNDLSQEEMETNGSGGEKTETEVKLEQLRSELLRDKQIRFYMCADLNELSRWSSTKSRSLDQIWLELFPATTAYENRTVFASNRPFNVSTTWSQKRATNSANECVRTPEPMRDLIVSLGSTESAYLKIIASTNINSHKHPKYASLLVLFEYFSQAEV